MWRSVGCQGYTFAWGGTTVLDELPCLTVVTVGALTRDHPVEFTCPGLTSENPFGSPSADTGTRGSSGRGVPDR